MRRRFTAPGVATIAHLSLTAAVMALGTLGNDLMREIFHRYDWSEDVFAFIYIALMMPIVIILPRGFPGSEIGSVFAFAIILGLNSTLVGYCASGVFLWVRRRIRKRNRNSTQH